MVASLIRSAIPVAGTIRVAPVRAVTIVIVAMMVSIVTAMIPVVAPIVVSIVIAMPTLLVVALVVPTFVMTLAAVVVTAAIAMVVVRKRGGHRPRQQRHCHGSSKQGLHVVSSLRRTWPTWETLLASRTDQKLNGFGQVAFSSSLPESL
jgi:hypothetical protein